MSKVIMGIGIPGSGKTTALKAFAEKHASTYISPDDIRAEITGDAGDQSQNRRVWKEAHTRAAEALGKGETVVFDATFAKGQERRSFIKFVRQHGAEKVYGLFADVGLERADERNRLRERTVPRHALETMHERLIKEPPKREDGFDAVWGLDELQEWEEVEKDGECEAGGGSATIEA